MFIYSTYQLFVKTLHSFIPRLLVTFPFFFFFSGFDLLDFLINSLHFHIKIIVKLFAYFFDWCYVMWPLLLICAWLYNTKRAKRVRLPEIG